MKKEAPAPLPPPSDPKCKDDENCKNPDNEKEGGAIAADQKKFGEDCYNFNIDAKKCHYQSAKNEDKSIMNYVRAINKKIYDETRTGGFSTNVQFRVTPQLTWLRGRGQAHDFRRLWQGSWDYEPQLHHLLGRS